MKIIQTKELIEAEDRGEAECRALFAAKKPWLIPWFMWKPPSNLILISRIFARTRFLDLHPELRVW